MIVYNYSGNLVGPSRKSYLKANTASSFNKNGNLIGNILVLENKFLMQILVIVVLTLAVFVAVQGLFNGSSLSTSAQTGTTNIVTNFDSGTNTGGKNSPRLIEIR